jgi:hypothetical protein
MFESTGWILEEPAIDDSSKYDSMCPTVVQPPRPDLLMSAQHAEVEVKYLAVYLFANNNINFFRCLRLEFSVNSLSRPRCSG